MRSSAGIQLWLWTACSLAACHSSSSTSAYRDAGPVIVCELGQVPGRCDCAVSTGETGGPTPPCNVTSVAAQVQASDLSCSIGASCCNDFGPSGDGDRLCACGSLTSWDCLGGAAAATDKSCVVPAATSLCGAGQTVVADCQSPGASDAAVTNSAACCADSNWPAHGSGCTCYASSCQTTSDGTGCVCTLGNQDPSYLNPQPGSTGSGTGVGSDVDGGSCASGPGICKNGDSSTCNCGTACERVCATCDYYCARNCSTDAQCAGLTDSSGNPLTCSSCPEGVCNAGFSACSAM